MSQDNKNNQDNSIPDKQTTDFLSFFPNTIFTYIYDHKEGDTTPAPIYNSILDLEKQKEGYGIFFSVNGFNGRRTSENLTNVNAFFCDIDYPNKENATKEEIHIYKNDIVMELTTGDVPVPTFIIGTKNGLHIYWVISSTIEISKLNKEQEDLLRNEYREIEEAILKKFEGDPGAKDISRVLRVPHTLHQKDPTDPYRIEILWNSPETTYKYSYIKNYFLKTPELPGWVNVNQSENMIDEEVRGKIEEKYPRLQRPSYKGLLDRTTDVPKGMRNKSLLIIANACRGSEWPLVKTLSHFTDFYGLGLREIRRTIASAYEHKYDFGYKNEVMAVLAPLEEREKLSEVTSGILSKNKKAEIQVEKNEQKKLYATFESQIAERYENLKYKLRGDFYDYKSGLYVPLQTNEVQSMILREMYSDGLLDYRKVSSVNDKIACFKSLPMKVFTHEDENKDRNIINLKNGLLNIQTNTLSDHTPSYISTVQIPIEYNDKADCPLWKKFISEIMSEDQEQVLLLQQITGYILTADTRFAKAFIFYGYGANGKSLFTRITSRLVGYENVSNINLTTLNKQFGLTGLIGKRLNLIDEISGNYFESNVIKTIISGERVSADIKYRPEPIEFEPTVKLLFSVNELPKINDTTPGLYRRFMIVPFLRSFLANPDLQLESKLVNELPGILNWAIKGLQDLSEKGAFNETDKNIEAMRVFKTENSPLLEFIYETYESSPLIDTDKYPISSHELYNGYKNYCYVNGYKAKSLVNFGRELSHFPSIEYKIEKRATEKGVLYYGLRPRTSVSGEQIIYPNH